MFSPGWPVGYVLAGSDRTPLAARPMAIIAQLAVGSSHRELWVTDRCTLALARHARSLRLPGSCISTASSSEALSRPTPAALPSDRQRWRLAASSTGINELAD
ncbi:hypothetical protein ACCAA_920029 [Candidatus Accumulibacter aalborgensis]|uniref:Uncharacterized protein n=1 Tax=Candidatus Accumulibacter aalborgensis TaxID=1860102 RepID=A0A1A8XZ80_9PROT|nr:hypothetical protein ACCAA_920029 [Candidatus Accumulibacter aalborgensis]